MNQEFNNIFISISSFYRVFFFFIFKGIIWPIESQPVWLKDYVSQYLPLTMASDSFRAIMEKNWHLDNSQVLKGFVATFVWTIIFSAIFLVMFSRRFRIQNWLDNFFLHIPVCCCICFLCLVLFLLTSLLFFKCEFYYQIAIWSRMN